MTPVPDWYSREISQTETAQMLQGMPGGFMVCENTEQTRVVYANQQMADYFACDTVEELLTYIGGTAQGMIHPEDRTRVVQAVIESVSSSPKDSTAIEYRILRKDGAVRWIVVYGHSVTTEEERTLLFLFIRDVTDRHIQDEAQNMRDRQNQAYLEALRSLGSSYEYVYRVDCATKGLSILRGDSDRVGITKALKSIQAYDESVQAYIAKNVYFDDRKLMMYSLDFNNLYRNLVRRPVFRQNYRVFRNNELHHYAMKAVRQDDKPDFDHFILGFANEDEDVAASENWRSWQGEAALRRRVLVIQDDPMDTDRLCDILGGDYEMLETVSGSMGLQMMQEHCHDLSMVLLDERCGGMTVQEFLMNISGDALLCSIPVIIMTAERNLTKEESYTCLGAVDFLQKPYNPTVILNRIRNIICIRQNAAEMKLVEYDDVTGLYTRQAFNHYAAQLLSGRPHTDFTLLVSDIDDFKQVNSIHGEIIGDRVLRFIAEELRRSVGSEDGVLARYSADRFVALIPSDRLPDSEQMQRQLLERRGSSPVEGLVVRLGVYARVDKSLKINRICDRAISALNTVKHSYDQFVGTYDSPLATRHRREHEMESTFAISLGRGEFLPWFQPKVEPHTGRTIGAEALVRWIKPDGTIIPPAAFVPLFEKDGLIARLDRYLFRKVCMMMADWQKKGLRVFPVSVNLSRTTLFSPGMVQAYQSIIEDSGVDPTLVPLEITESANMPGSMLRELVKRLKDVGFVLHMDDFGSGYSSLTSLGEMPFDAVKIDKSLIDNIRQDKGMTIIRHTISFAHELGMRVVAEGVETESQAMLLEALRCDAIQGYLYGRPMPLQDFEKAAFGS